MERDSQDHDKSGNLTELARFEQVELAERRAILRRRARATGASPPGHGSELKPVHNLVGIALSGGGIRSASFCLGALQALDVQKVIGRADYLSTVSGGGYIGASMIAAITAKAKASSSPSMKSSATNAGTRQTPASGADATREKTTTEIPFPFNQDDMCDTNDVGHLRDNSRYLFPKGLDDILRSWGILFRGLVVNLILVLSVILPLATTTIIANPTMGHLGRSFVADVCVASGWASFGWCYHHLSDRFLLTETMLVLLFVLLTAWGVSSSLKDRNPSHDYSRPDYRSGMALILKWALLIFTVVFIAEVQTLVLERLIISLRDGIGTSMGTLTAFVTGLGSVSATLTLFRQQLTNIAANAMGGDTTAALVKSATAKLALYVAALFMPLVVYTSYLVLSAIGIAIPEASFRPYFHLGYPLLPSLLLHDAYIGLLFLVLLVAGFICAMVQTKRYWKTSIAREALAKASFEPKATGGKIAIILVYAACLVAVAYATRMSIADRASWTVLQSFLWLSGIFFVISISFTENANALHALYRDRLNSAFRLGKGSDGRYPRTEPLPLEEIDTDNAPYLLVNATLNATRIDDSVLFERGRVHDPKAASVVDEHKTRAIHELHARDPARRGRRAEFFLFSKDFIGSDATGYARSQTYDDPRPVDLATAVAISGAAVSSSSGRIVPSVLSPTLALLNLRLGFWLDNPQYKYQSYAEAIGKQKWTEIFRLYLLQEAFGLLRTTSRKLLLSDGGHIDNIGLYQLLKRRCKVIIIIDAEADPAMNFGALADAQRFARIDLGHRVSIDWTPLREFARVRNADRSKPTAKDQHDQHFAIGTILYSTPKGEIEEGTILYVKANVTGDEPDYVLDYERRYPAFPHETTMDQLFSEEQMEAYRALGFHSVSRALAPDGSPRSEQTEALLRRLRLVLNSYGDGMSADPI
jgi:hypothetical protein